MATKKVVKPAKAADAKKVPLGSGMADKAKGALMNRAAAIDAAVDGAKRKK